MRLSLSRYRCDGGAGRQGLRGARRERAVAASGEPTVARLAGASILVKPGRRGADDEAFPGTVVQQASRYGCAAGLIWAKERDGVGGRIFGFPVDSIANCIFGLPTLLDQ